MTLLLVLFYSLSSKVGMVNLVMLNVQAESHIDSLMILK